MLRRESATNPRVLSPDSNNEPELRGLLRYEGRQWSPVARQRDLKVPAGSEARRRTSEIGLIARHVHPARSTRRHAGVENGCAARDAGGLQGGANGSDDSSRAGTCLGHGTKIPAETESDLPRRFSRADFGQVRHQRTMHLVASPRPRILGRALSFMAGGGRRPWSSSVRGNFRLGRGAAAV